MSLRLGVVSEAGSPSGWQDRCLGLLLGTPGVEIGLVVDVRRRGPRQPVEPDLWPPWRDGSSGHRIDAGIDGHDPGRLRLTPEDTARIRQADLDVILHLSTAEPAAVMATAARYGVWSFHHGDDASYSAGPITGWEPHCAGPVLQVALLATVADGRRRLLLQAGCLGVQRSSWRDTLATTLALVAEWPAKVCREALHQGQSPLAGAREAAFAVLPSGRPFAVIGRRLRRRLAELGGRLAALRASWRRDQWTIGLVHAPIQTFLDHPNGQAPTWLPEPSGRRYLADPFAIRSPAGVLLLAECYDHEMRLGQLCALESGDGRRFGPPRPILPLPVHLAYPYLFEDEGAIYCIPEMHQSRGVHLFRAHRYPTDWRFVTTLIEDFPGVDPTLMRHDGRLWMFCTTRADHNVALHVWWAPRLTGPWRPHLRNPVKYDIRSARPGGTPFEHREQVFRPSQDCSETYGGAVRINRILRLTTTEYEEETVAVVRPDPKGPFPAGLHTLSAAGDWTLIDGKRRAWRFPGRRRGIGRHPEAETLKDRLERLRAGP